MKKPMSKTRKYLIYLFVIVLLAIFAIGLWWVRTRTDKEMKAEVLSQMSQVEAVMSQSQKENVALLSVKYGIEKARLEKILDAYLYKHDVAYRVNKYLSNEKKGGNDNRGQGGYLAVDLDFATTIDNLSVQYEIPKDRLAALIADYKVLSRLEKDNALEVILSSRTRQSVMKFSLKGFYQGAKGLFRED